ncbi:MAG TPA: polysaccharide biosynthesis tyrosine autokinase [Pyrinomonadaceae bacterium]|jgi:capsular exopolysaccharide synthesis family protein
MKINSQLMKNRVPDVEEHLELVDYRQPYAGAFDAAPTESEDAAHVRDFLHCVRRYLWLIISVVFISTALVGLYMARQPDLYEAEAQVQVDLETVNTALTASKSGAFSVNPVNDPAYFNTQLQILTRPMLLRRVVKNLQLEHDPEFRLPAGEAGSLKQRLASFFGVGTQAESLKGQPVQALAIASETQGDSARDAGMSAEEMAEAVRVEPYVQAIQSSLKVEPVKEVRLPIKETRLINVSFSHQNPQTAARVVNAIAEAFIQLNLERKTEMSTTTGDILQGRISELQAQIRAQETQLLDYAKNHQILSLDASQNTVVERLVGINRQLLEAENERKVAEAAYQSALAPGAAGALAEGSAKAISEVEGRLAQLQQHRAQLLVETTEEWPEVKETNNQIAALENQLRQMRERATSVVVTNLNTRYRQALAREQALRSAFDRQRSETLTQNEAAINYRILQQEIETNKGLLDGMLQRSKEHEAVSAGMRNNIHVNDYAIPPQAPVGPKRLLVTGIAFALSLGVGLGLAVFLGFTDNRVRSTDDVQRALPLPTLAVIPSVNGASRRRLKTSSASVVPKNNGDGAHAEDLELLLNSNASAPLTEAYRQLRTSMLLSKGHGGLKSFLVTSSIPGEGKTTMAVNTAISLSRTGALVLIIDADLHKPRLHEIFGLKNEKGLSTILSSELSDVEALAVPVHHKESRLDVLTSGPIVPESAELLGSDHMRRLLHTFRYTYDYIVIDSPPVAYFTDGVLISSMVDGVVLVLNSGRSKREMARHSYQLLQGVGANICGVVLNNARGLKFDYKHYYRQP